MSRINVLSKEISELIAAGEVIERPCSVIKELVENAIDSGANIITVEIKNGGITYMRITDNGCGISADDVPVAFLRHATSKIAIKADLDTIMSLGFRGEALASVCAVSKVDLMTKRTEDDYGTHYSIEGAVEKGIDSIGCPDGTTIVVRDLFYNVPARLKFLKKAVTEGNSVASVINKLALSHPEISFKFIRDNKQDLLTPGDGKLYSSIYSVFGKDFAKSLIPVDYQTNGITVTGFTVKPLLSRPNRAFQHFFINNRYVKSVTCTVALEEAYRNSIMTGKFPACVINLSIPPQIVDVNVHPAKIEVRFSDEKMIFDSIFFAVKNSLLENDTVKELVIDNSRHFAKSELKIDEKPADVAPVQYKFSSQNMTLNSCVSQYKTESDCKSQPEPVAFVYNDKANETHLTDNNDGNSMAEEVKTSETAFIEKPQIINENIDGFKFLNNDSFKAPIKEPEIIAEEDVKKSISVRLIGEAFTTYIIAQVDDELLLIDKHAAHERYNFERLKKEKNLLSSQLMLTPQKILLSDEEYDAVINNGDVISSLGFVIEEDEAPSVRVVGVPSILKDADITDLICELAHNIIVCKNDPSLKLMDDLYHSIACKSSVKAHDFSSQQELMEIIKILYENQNIKYCPHGRPVMVKMSRTDIEKQFKRIV